MEEEIKKLQEELKNIKNTLGTLIAWLPELGLANQNLLIKKLDKPN